LNLRFTLRMLVGAAPVWFGQPGAERSSPSKHCSTYPRPEHVKPRHTGGDLDELRRLTGFGELATAGHESGVSNRAADG
jgi:hypothetical protein